MNTTAAIIVPSDGQCRKFDEDVTKYFIAVIKSINFSTYLLIIILNSTCLDLDWFIYAVSAGTGLSKAQVEAAELRLPSQMLMHYIDIQYGLARS